MPSEQVRRVIIFITVIRQYALLVQELLDKPPFLDSMRRVFLASVGNRGLSIPQRQQQPQQTSYMWGIGRMSILPRQQQPQRTSLFVENRAHWYFGLVAAAVAIPLVSPEYPSAPAAAEVSYLCKIGCMSIPQRQQQPQQTSYVWKIGRMNLYT